MHLTQGGRHLLVHPEAPRWSVVNQVGYQVVRLCDGHRTIADITAAIAQRYGQDPANVRADVLAYLNQLRLAGLLADDYAAPRLPAVPTLTHLHLHLTRECNLRCVHCAIMDGRQGPGVLSTERIVALIDEFAAAGGRSIALTGGEPLLRPDAPAIIEHAARRLHTTLATNGTLVTHRVAAAVADLGVVLQISLDGATAEVHDRIRGEGAFQQTWRGIERLQRTGAGEWLNLCMTVMRPNAHQGPALLDLAEARGVPGVRFYPLQRLGRAVAAWGHLCLDAEAQAGLYRYLYLEVPAQGRRIQVGADLPGLQLRVPEDGLWCALGRTLAVDANGDVYPCSLLMQPGFRLGNVADAPLTEVLASEKLGELIGLCEGRKDEIADCRACVWRHFCQASCPGSIWVAHGTWHATDGLCDLRRELFRELIFERAAMRTFPISPACLENTVHESEVEERPPHH
jgi:radical SAM protein with 4Fe4S-binding SPASM domain